MKNLVRALFILIIINVIITDLYAQEPAVDSIIKLKVGVKHTPPFIISENNRYSGVCIDLWKNIATQLNVEYEFVEYDLQGLLDALNNQEIDVCINPLTVTSHRLEGFDFTQPFFISNLSIAVSGKLKKGFFGSLSGFFDLTINFIKAVSALLFVILIFGVIVWLAERKKNPQFPNSIKGFFDGIWWSAVTMTTVGYGDKAPVSRMGRIFATVWMFTSIIIISSLTASIAASLTINRFESIIEEVDDLKKIPTGTIEASSSEGFLLNNHINYKTYENINAGIEALIQNDISAFVYDEPILRYIVKNRNLGDKIHFINNLSNSEYYSFALPHNHDLIKPINMILIKELESVRWKGILNRYSLKQ